MFLEVSHYGDRYSRPGEANFATLHVRESVRSGIDSGIFPWSQGWPEPNARGVLRRRPPAGSEFLCVQEHLLSLLAGNRSRADRCCCGRRYHCSCSRASEPARYSADFESRPGSNSLEHTESGLSRQGSRANFGSQVGVLSHRLASRLRCCVLQCASRSHWEQQRATGLQRVLLFSHAHLARRRAISRV